MSQPLGEERRVVPFAVPPGRLRRRALDDTSGRGAVLLFTGVRYERSERTDGASLHGGPPGAAGSRRGS